MSNFTFLTEEQCFGNDKLDILEKRGTQAAITDFSVLLGGWVSDYHVDNDSSLEGRTGYYWTKSDDGDNDARVVTVYGSRFLQRCYHATWWGSPSFTVLINRLNPHERREWEKSKRWCFWSRVWILSTKISIKRDARKIRKRI